MLRRCGLRGGRAQVTCAYKSSFSSREKPLVIQLVPKRSGFVQQALGRNLRTAWSRDSLTTHPVSASSVRKLNQNGTQRIPPCQSTVRSLRNFYPATKFARVDFAIVATRILREKRNEVVGQRREEFEWLARSRMRNRKRQRMQRLPIKVTRVALLRATIDAIAEAWMTDRREMHANLMHPAGLGLHPHQRRAQLEIARGLEALEHGYVANRIARHVRSHRHFFALNRMASDRALDRDAIGR